jgi:hypothetical protein
MMRKNLRYGMLSRIDDFATSGFLNTENIKETPAARLVVMETSHVSVPCTDIACETDKPYGIKYNTVSPWLGSYFISY